MKRLLFVLAVTTSYLPIATGAVSAENLYSIQIMEDGRSAGSAQGYWTGSRTYIEISQLCRALGGQPNWYQVSGRVYCSLKGRKLLFTNKRSVVKADDKEFPLEAPVAVRGGQAFAPMTYFLTPGFSGLVGRATRYDNAAKVLELEKLPNIGGLRRRSAGAAVVFELDLKAKLEAATTKKGRNRVDILLAGGVLAKEESWTSETGPVREARLEQAREGARLVLILAAPDAAYQVTRKSDPMRLSVEVQGEGAVAPPPAIAVPEAGRRRRIVVDAGHGGKDPGTSGRGMKEKDLVLGICKELADILRGSGDFEVLMTRDSDVFVPLDERSNKANQFGADLFVSVHVNHHPNAKENGMEVYFLSEKASNTEAALVAQFENSVLGLQESQPQDMEAAVILSELEKTELINESALLAGNIAKTVDKQVDVENRGVKQAQFFVLHWTRAPAVLVETAFISNPKDAGKLASKSWRRRMAEAIHSGVVEYAKSKSWL